MELGPSIREEIKADQYAKGWATRRSGSSRTTVLNDDAKSKRYGDVAERVKLGSAMSYQRNTGGFQFR